MPSLPGILLAVFGVGTEGGKTALLDFADKVRASFPGHAVRWAFTTERTDLRPALAGEPGLSIGEALSRFAGENTHKIALQPLLLTDGQEYDALCRQVTVWQRRHPATSVAVGAPLLEDAAAMRAALAAMRRIEESFAAPGEAVIWVGHGNGPGLDAAYKELAALGEAERPPIYVDCLLPPGAAERRIRFLAEVGTSAACLMPLFVLAGNHTLQDLAGDAATSWKSRFTAAGIACRVPLRGMLEYEAFAAIWLEHLANALKIL